MNNELLLKALSEETIDDFRKQLDQLTQRNYELRMENADLIAQLKDVKQPEGYQGIRPRPLAHPLSDYHDAPGGGPLHATWLDKPHRLLYDLVAALVCAENEAIEAVLAQRTPPPSTSK